MIIFGEKINAFSPRTKQAIDARDDGYIREIAKGQTQAHADYLDICAGTDEEVEKEAMEWLIGLAQEASDVPLCLDSSNPDLLVELMGLCNKEGMINSVSMEEGKIETIFPAVADTNWKIIALTCDNDGIPDDAPTKLKIADQIIAAADEYGIAHERLFIDPLVTTMATKPDSLVNFVEGIRVIHEKYPDVHFTSGLSNISYGMPYRKAINMQFLCLAMNAGMDSAIMNPMSKDMQATLRATAALLGQDSYCLEYIMAYREGMFPVKPEE